MFDLGEVCPTRGVVRYTKQMGVDMMMLLLKHSNGEWPGLTPTEVTLNMDAIEKERVVYSRYKLGEDVILISTNIREGHTKLELSGENDSWQMN